MHSKWLGTIRYSVALELQALAQIHTLASREDGIIYGLEHEPVVTLGRKLSDDKLTHNMNTQRVEERTLLSQSFEVFQTDRGGQVTMHTPGQLVIYPILNLNRLGLSVREFVSLLEKTTLRVLSEFGIESHKKTDSTGLYTVNGKIGFVGIRVSHHVTSHGLSLNVSNNLNWFREIVCCGVQDQPMDSLQKQGVGATPREVFEVWIKAFDLTLQSK